MDAPNYEILAFNFGSHPGRLQGDNYVFPDDHAAPMPLTYYIFAIRGGGRVFVVDTGFTRDSALRRNRIMVRSPPEALAQAGIQAEEVRDVVLTHMHWDHAGGMDAFPRALFHIQEAEMEYCTGRCMCYHALRHPFEADDVVNAVRALFADRIRFYNGTAELAPGITLHLIGGHSRGIQVLRVHTARGWVVLAGDATHYWGNIRRRNPFPVVVDVARMLAGYDELDALADGPDHVIPGHDPLIVQRFPRLDGNPDIVRLDLAPIA